MSFSFGFAQRMVSGVVKDQSGQGLPGVNIVEKGTQNGVSTDLDGAYKIKVSEGATLVYSFIGYDKIERVANNDTVDVVLSAKESGENLDEIVVTGSRTAPRSNTKSALPIDVLSAKDLTSTGQATFDKALQYKIPSFNTVQTPVNDATSLLDPYEIRNLGPSRTLVLINGKRKNMSALLYTQTSPGRGETGADISAIPQDAIARVEILRDGASAQYGSDAIAGVMNIILKKNTDGGSATLRTGITGKGDGETIGVSLNNGSKVGKNGFLNYTVDFSRVNLANRPGILNAQDEADYWGVPVSRTEAFLKIKPDGGNVNGSPDTVAAKFEVNGGSELSEKTNLYYNAAYVYKKVNSFANYRAPYWRDNTAPIASGGLPYLSSLYGNGTPSSYIGYVPTFIGDLNDYNATFGFKNKSNGWNTDASLTTGGNSQVYTVTNSQNRSKDTAGNFLYALNPNEYTGQTTFKPGGTKFNHYVGNLDITKELSDVVSIGFGSEFRTENFEVLEGDFQSYDGLGADSFQGNRPEASGKFNRYNLGAYFEADFNLTEDFLLNGAFRHEQYSDFGDASVWKMSSRYKFLDDKLTFRGSVSTGFRAPSLHQIYTEKSQSTFAGGNIAVTGIVSNVSTAARKIGVEKLKAEKSQNITLGVGLEPVKNLTVTLDYYNIKVKDRIILGNLVAGQAWFSNAIDSKTSGVDFVAGYRNIEVGTGKLGLNLSGNYTLENGIDGAFDKNLFNPTQDALMFTSRPKFKYIFGGDLQFGKFGFTLNNTVFGPTKFKNADFSSTDGTPANNDISFQLNAEFLTKNVTDLGINYSATDNLSFAFNMNNMFNVKPEYKVTADTPVAQSYINVPANLKKEISNITFNGRYDRMTYDGYHFSQLGTMFNLSMNYKF